MVQATLRGHKIRNAKSINYDEVRGITQVEVPYHLRTGCRKPLENISVSIPALERGHSL
jgi:hypothetical protein